MKTIQLGSREGAYPTWFSYSLYLTNSFFEVTLSKLLCMTFRISKPLGRMNPLNRSNKGIIWFEFNIYIYSRILSFGIRIPIWYNSNDKALVWKPICGTTIATKKWTVSTKYKGLKDDTTAHKDNR